MNIIEEKWDSVVDTLSTEFGFSPISINTWIKPLQVQRYDSDEGTLFIYVPIDEFSVLYLLNVISFIFLIFLFSLINTFILLLFCYLYSLK